MKLPVSTELPFQNTIPYLYNHTIMFCLLSCALVLFFSCSVLRADCDGEGWEIFPDGATLSPQPIIVLDGQFGSATTIDSIQAGTPIYLRSKQRKVQLNVVEFLAGDMGRKQIVLTPGKITSLTLDVIIAVVRLCSREAMSSKPYLRRWMRKVI